MMSECRKFLNKRHVHTLLRHKYAWLSCGKEFAIFLRAAYFDYSLLICVKYVCLLFPSQNCCFVLASLKNVLFYTVVGCLLVLCCALSAFEWREHFERVRGVPLYHHIQDKRRWIALFRKGKKTRQYLTLDYVIKRVCVCKCIVHRRLVKCIAEISHRH